MGRDFDGRYAEYTGVIGPGRQIGGKCLVGRLLIRGGTTSIGLVAAVIAGSHGVYVAATTRKPEREMLLQANGAQQIFIDNSTITKQVN